MGRKDILEAERQFTKLLNIWLSGNACLNRDKVSRDKNKEKGVRFYGVRTGTPKNLVHDLIKIRFKQSEHHTLLYTRVPDASIMR